MNNRVLATICLCCTVGCGCAPAGAGWTAWVDGAGAVHFRDDDYGRDGVAPVAASAP